MAARRRAATTPERLALGKLPAHENKNYEPIRDWTWKSATSQHTKKMYDGFFVNFPWKCDGPRQFWHVRSDRRPVSAQVLQSQPGLIRIENARRSPMWGWLLTRTGAARLARKWASWAPRTCDEIQMALEEAATSESEALEGARHVGSGERPHMSGARARSEAATLQRIAALDEVARLTSDEEEELRARRAAWRHRRRLRDIRIVTHGARRA